VTVYAFMLVFLIGSVSGWILELNFRTFVSQKKLVNPGFLAGPYLPLYGFGAVILFYLSIPQMPIAYRALLFFVVMTILEWVTGEIFLHFFNIRLWDYTSQKWNYKGLVCPVFSVFWTILSLVFYFFAYPPLKTLALETFDSVYVFLGIGFFYGIFSEDVVVSFHLASRLSKSIRKEVEAQREKWKVRVKEISMEQRIVDFRLLKLQIRHKGEQPGAFSVFLRYFNPFGTFLSVGKDHENIHQSVKSYFEASWIEKKKKRQ